MSESPIPPPDDPSLSIARLEGRVAALEEALERRSRELCQLQRLLPARELAALSRLLAGLPPSPASPYDPLHWRETTFLTDADVEETLTDLWRTVAPPAPASAADAGPAGEAP